jgi:hypothetical protein
VAESRTDHGERLYIDTVAQRSHDDGIGNIAGDIAGEEVVCKTLLPSVIILRRSRCCHPEERSEGSASHPSQSRSFAALRMTTADRHDDHDAPRCSVSPLLTR